MDKLKNSLLIKYLISCIICVCVRAITVNNGCSYSLNEEKCIIEGYCTFGSILNADHMLNDFTHYEHCSTLSCQYHGYCIPVNLIYKNTENSQILVNDDYLRNIIISMDLSENNYITPPLISELQNLRVLNMSYNMLTSAKLSNQLMLDSLKVIDYSYNKISYLEIAENEHIFNHLVHLNISHNKIRTTPINVLANFFELQNLDLSYNEIANISVYTFEGISQLLILRLSHNNVVDINMSLFRFSSLEELYMDNNKITTISVTTFENMNNIKVLDLSYNLINYIEENVFQNMESLKTINLGGNLLTNIGKNIFMKNIYLVSLDLSQNKLVELPSHLFSDKNVTMFSVRQNNIRGPLQIRLFEGLKINSVLDLSSQALTKIEQYAFFGLEKLPYLLLNKNFIESISDKSFITLKSLKLLDLSNNRINNINFDKNDLISLESLLLKGNYILEINNNQLLNLNSLQFIDLSFNNISKIQTESFVDLSHVNTFEIGNNPLIGQLKSYTFQGLTSLPKLDMSWTFLNIVQNNSLDGMFDLVELNISHSDINEIQFNTFFNTENIKILDLSYNKISSFFVNSSHLCNLNELLLDNNHIKSLSNDLIKGMIYLSKISISYNNIVNVSTNVFYFQKELSYLDLSNNVNLYLKLSILREAKQLDTLILSNIPSNISFSDYENVPVRKLEIKNANITNFIDLNLCRLNKLIILQLSCNKVSQLQVGSFSNLSDIREIDISFNKISVIQPGVFKNNLLLNKLNISHNALLDIGYGVFQGVSSLRILDLSFNIISSLESESFYQTGNLTELIIDHNQIKNIPIEVVRETSLSTISIGDNPISCRILANFVKNSGISVTAIRLTDFEYNSYGITCKVNGFKSNVNHSPSSDKFNESVLFEIRDILSELNSKQNSLDGQLNVAVNQTNLGILQENNTKEIDKLSNSVSILLKENKMSNSLLEMILKEIISTNSLNKPLPTSDNVTSENFLSYINKIRQDMASEMMIDKQRILAEVDDKLSVISRRVDATTLTNILPSTKSEHLLKSSNESNSVFVETCVAIILIILVCLILWKIYKSRMYILRSRSMSTRQIPDAMEVSNV